MRWYNKAIQYARGNNSERRGFLMTRDLQTTAMHRVPPNGRRGKKAKGISLSASVQASVQESIQDYQLGGHKVELEISQAVFQPTLTSRLLAQLVQVPSGASVLDLGCGTGVLAIVAALKGAAHVDAVDVMVESRPLVEANARRNRVADRVAASSGDLFESVGAQRYDVIINDVSGVADEVARLSPWYPPSIPTGGHDGADHIVRMLSVAREHLQPGGSLYFPTGSISNIPRTLEAARTAFGEKLEMIEQVEVPFCTEFRENMDVMLRLRAEGVIDFVTRRSRHLWALQFYRCWA
jgi:methylase of polypeptide subunit release factors